MPGSKVKDLLNDYPVLIDLADSMKRRVESQTETDFEKKKAQLVLKSLRMLANRALRAELQLGGERSQSRENRDVAIFFKEVSEKWRPLGP